MLVFKGRLQLTRLTLPAAAFAGSLRFEDKPDYSFLKRLFKDLYTREGFATDYTYDWDLKKKASSRGHGGSVGLEAGDGAVRIAGADGTHDDKRLTSGARRLREGDGRERDRSRHRRGEDGAERRHRRGEDDGRREECVRLPSL